MRVVLAGVSLRDLLAGVGVAEDLAEEGKRRDAPTGGEHDRRGDGLRRLPSSGNDEPVTPMSLPSMGAWGAVSVR